MHPLPEGGEENFDTFHALLNEWNARMDLTNIKEEEALERHYLDSLTALPYLPFGARVIDVGTGAGFPGMPLAIARPDLSVTLLDAREKRVAFLNAALARLKGVRAEAVHARVEIFAREHPEAYDIAVSRAVAPAPVLLEWMLPLLRIGGRCILWKGPAIEKELQEARRVSVLLGGGPPELLDAELPGRQFVHLCVTKVEGTDARFPRKPGMALKRPL